MRTIQRIAIICFFILASSGCAIISHKKQIRVLRDLSDSQTRINRFLKEQEQGFGRLKEDIAHNRLKEGISKNTAVLRYSGPIYCRKVPDALAEEMCLYRHPTEYFNTDSAELYFDAKEKLVSWKYTPVQK